jgi:hypothetical protein
MTYHLRHADAIAERASTALARHWQDASPSGNWFDAYWSAAATPEPDEPPQAVTLLGNLPAIRWYRRGDSLIGYAHGRHDGCYVVPTSLAIRLAPATATHR